MNYKLTLQYDGTGFHGWQMQDAGRTVQGELTRALSLLEGADVTVHGAGRTDAGVHAEAQVASVRLSREFAPDKLRDAVNGNVGRDLRVTRVEVVDEEFHARFSARGKVYCYRVFGERFMSPFWARYALHEPRGLDVELMRSLGAIFVGEHDWTAFSAAQSDVKSRVRRVTRLEVTAAQDARGRGQLIEIRVAAAGFLRFMVRTIAGTLLAAGRGECGEDEIGKALSTGTRPRAFVTAPAHGLTLEKVFYGDGGDRSRGGVDSPETLA